MNFLFPDLGFGLEVLQGLLDVYSKGVVVFHIYIHDYSDVSVLRFGLWCNVEVLFVEDCSIK